MISLKNFAGTAAFALILALAAPLAGADLPVLGVSFAHAETVGNVVVKGNSRIDTESIKNYLLIKPGHSYTPADIDASVKALYATGLFSDVTINRQGNSLVVAVVENPVINTVIFEGNKKVKAEILVALVESRARGVLTDAKLQSDAQKIKDYYAHAGRSLATVDPKVTTLPNNRVDIDFVISDGDKTGISSIHFVGNKAFSEQRLRGIIQTRQTNWLSWLNHRDVYDQNKLDGDQELLRRYYMSHGYADFRVLSAEGTFDQEKGKYFVTFTLDEGDRYKFGAINIDSSIPGVDTQALAGLVSTKTGAVFNSTALEKSVQDLTIELAKNGYAFAQVKPRGDRNYTDHTVGITYMIDEGPRVYVERIDIHGNVKTRDYVIRREFDLSEGDAYNRVLVDTAERRLRDLGYFKAVSITTSAGSTSDKVIIDVSVTEQATGSFSVAGGMSSTDGFIAEVSMDEQNFLGRGQQLRVAVGTGIGTGSNERTYTVSFTDPYFLGNHMSFGVDAYRNESTASSLRPFDMSTTGGDIRIGLPITDALNVQFNYKLFQDSVSRDSTNTDCTTNPQNCLYFLSGDALTSSVGTVLTYSTIDNKLDPREGTFFKVSADFAGVGGDTSYLRTVADARYYHEVIPDSDVIGLMRVTGGNITGIGQPVRSLDNFFKGGETIRGFASLGIGPRDADGVAVGGRNYVAGTAEFQFPLPGFPPDFGLRGAVFGDAGTLFGVDSPAGTSPIDDNAIRSSVGASILWASPFGLLRADFAHVITQASNDKTQFFRFSAGTQF
jgi:outer membrane protein insertion porin family